MYCGWKAKTKRRGKRIIEFYLHQCGHSLGPGMMGNLTQMLEVGNFPWEIAGNKGNKMESFAQAVLTMSYTDRNTSLLLYQEQTILNPSNINEKKNNFGKLNFN